MWSRDTWLEPDIAKATLETVSHAVEVSLTHFFAQAGIILLPSASKCETVPLLQAGKKLGAQEKVITGVIYPFAESSGDCIAVMFSEAIGAKAAGEAKKWDDRLLRLRESASALVDPVCKALELPEFGDPSFIFDMQAAAVQALAAHAAVDRTTATVISVHLNGLDSGEWADILAIVGTNLLHPRREVRRVA